VLLVSQASSEQSLCLGVRAADAETALDVLRRTFAFELETGRIRRIYLVPECATVSVVATACATSRDWPDACSRRSGRPT